MLLFLVDVLCHYLLFSWRVYPHQDFIPTAGIFWTPYLLYDLQFYYIEINTSTSSQIYTRPAISTNRFTFKEQKPADSVHKQFKILVRC